MPAWPTGLGLLVAVVGALVVLELVLEGPALHMNCQAALADVPPGSESKAARAGPGPRSGTFQLGRSASGSIRAAIGPPARPAASFRVRMRRRPRSQSVIHTAKCPQPRWS
jgi:hypothetical protein